MCTPYHTRRCVRRFWGFARRYVKSQKEPERNLANVVLLFVVHARSMMHVRNRTKSYEIVRNRTNSHGIVRNRTKSYEFVRNRTNSYDFVRNRTNSYDFVRIRTISYDFARYRANSCDFVRFRTTSCDFVHASSNARARQTAAPHWQGSFRAPSATSRSVWRNPRTCARSGVCDTVCT